MQVEETQGFMHYGPRQKVLEILASTSTSFHLFHLLDSAQRGPSCQPIPDWAWTSGDKRHLQALLIDSRLWDTRWIASGLMHEDRQMVVWSKSGRSLAEHCAGCLRL